MGKRGPKKGAPNAGAPPKIPKEQRQNIVNQVCNYTATSSLSLINILKKHDYFPDYVTFYSWLKNDANLSNDYAHAKKEQADYLADEMLSLADDAKDYNKARLQIDTRKWLASKLKAKKYGDKIQADVDASLTVKLVQFGGKEDKKE